MSVDYKAIGNRIKIKRKSRKLTQDHLSEKLDVTVGYVSQVERGATKISLDLLCRISTILDCDISYFITGISADQNNYLADDFTKKFSQLSKEQKRLIVSLIELQLTQNKQKTTASAVVYSFSTFCTNFIDYIDKSDVRFYNKINVQKV